MSPGDDGPPLWPGLRGMRLGALERTLLVAAPPQGRFGMLIDAPERARSAQQGYLRAARKLERYGLIEIVGVDFATRIPDRRRARAFYRRGRFWLRVDQTRTHITRRRALWATERGEAVRAACGFELHHGRPIRWTDETLRRIDRYEETHRPPSSAEIRAMIDETRDVLLAKKYSSDERLVEARPDAVTDDDEDRWLAAIAVARRGGPRPGAAPRWEEARRLYDSSQSLAELEKAAGWTSSGERAGKHPLRFRRLDLGMIISTRGHPPLTY
jgi:hypothetical protein